MRGISSLVFAVRNEYGALAAVQQVITRNTNTTVIPRESGISSNHRSQRLLDHPLSRMMTSEKADMLAVMERQ
jgi:hypothetical protein